MSDELQLPPGTPATPRVVGLDISLTGTGIAHSDGWCARTGWKNVRRPVTRLPHGERLAVMRGVRDDILRLVIPPGPAAPVLPDLAVMEAPALSRSGGGAHERAWLWWDVYAALSDAGVPVALMSAKGRAKYATGNGNAVKGAVIDAVARRWPQWETGGDDNLADAVVLAAAGLHHLGWPPSPVPKRNAEALGQVHWPGMVAAA